MMPTMKTTMITVIMAMTNLIYILRRCCPHARTPKNCNTTEQQRLRSVASLTHFLPARWDWCENYCDVIIFRLLGSASTESFCWTSARGGELSKWAIELRQHEHRCPCFFKLHLTTRWGEGAAPGPCTCTSNPSLRFPTSYLILHSPCLGCNPLYEKLSQSRRHGQVRPAAYGEAPGAQARFIQTKEAKYKLVKKTSLKPFILPST